MINSLRKQTGNFIDGGNEMNKSKLTKFILKLLLYIVLPMYLCTSCFNFFLYDKGRTEQITSPSGQTTITLKYDWMSRPFVFYKGKKVFEYNGSAFMESVYFKVQWVSETEIILYLDMAKYKDEYYSIVLEF